MFRYSVYINNFNIFDTYFVYRDVNLIANVGRKANGIHISRAVGQYLSSQIITHITHLHSQYANTREVWPLRPMFRHFINVERYGG